MLLVNCSHHFSSSTQVSFLLLNTLDGKLRRARTWNEKYPHHSLMFPQFHFSTMCKTRNHLSKQERGSCAARAALSSLLHMSKPVCSFTGSAVKTGFNTGREFKVAVERFPTKPCFRSSWQTCNTNARRMCKIVLKGGEGKFVNHPAGLFKTSKDWIMLVGMLQKRSVKL